MQPFPLCFISCILMFCSLKRSQQAVFFSLSLVLKVAHYLTVLIQCLFNLGTDKAFAGFPGYLIHTFYKVCRWHNSCQKMAWRCYSFAILIFHRSAKKFIRMTKMKREKEQIFILWIWISISSFGWNATACCLQFLHLHWCQCNGNKSCFMYAIIMGLSETEANEDRIQNSKVTLFLTHVRHSSRKTWQTKQAVLCNHKWEKKKL